MRTWKDTSGSFSIEAEFVSQDAASVTLRKQDNREITVPLAKLSSGDRRYLAQLKPPKASAPKDASRSVSPLPARLSKKADFQFSQTPLPEVVEIFRQEHRLPILLDRQALEEIGLEITTEISYSKSNVSVADALTELLNPHSLEWTIDHGAVIVTSKDNAENRQSTRVYRVNRGANAVSAIVSLTKEIVPDSWEETGGPGSSAVLPPHFLIISQRQLVHQQIMSKYARTLTLVAHRPITLEALQVNMPVEFLLKPMELGVIEGTVSEVAGKLSEAAGAKITVDEQAMQSIGLSPDTPITVDLTELPLIDALILAVRPLKMTVSINADSIIITTRKADRANLISARYATGALQPNALQNAINSTTSPDSWQVLGGPGQMAFTNPGVLEIKQTLEVHLEIAQLLRDLQ